jgi:signal transduction histidine kinase
MVTDMIKDRWSPSAVKQVWNAFSFLSLSVFSWVGFTIIVTLAAVSLGLLITYPLATPFIFLTFYFSMLFARLERSRVSALLDVHIAEPHLPPLQGPWWSRVIQVFRSTARWKAFVYTLLLPIYGTLFMVIAVTLWAGSLMLIGLPFTAESLPGGSAEFGLFNIDFGFTAIAASAVGLAVFLVVAPTATLGLGRLCAVIASALLGPGEETLREEVASLKESRSAAATIAETERQRIERDLHDGAQQRLVALAMDLGRAEAQFDQNPEAARALLASARGEAAAALTELRDLVRGVHPAILSDRGLDAALSAVVARSPIPVELSVNVAQRPPAPVESASYFIVTEALMNAIKHAEATAVRIDIVRAGDSLAISIGDNGKGGADPAKGTGLKGLQDRVTALGGWMQIISPQGGPTSVMVELSCA